MAKLDDIIEDLREQGREEDAEELEKLRGSTLREKAKRAEQLEKELATERSKREALEKGPKVRAAFEKAGINFESLSKLERKAIEAYDGDLDEDDVASFIEDNELSVDEGDPDEGEPEKDEEPAAAKVAKAARRSGERKGDPTKVTPETVAEWGMDKKLVFADANPDAWEALKRGETVTGVKVPV